MSEGRGRILMVVGLACLGMTLPAAAHEGHNKKKPSPSPAPSAAAPASPAAGAEAAPAGATTEAPASARPAAAETPAPPTDEQMTLKNLPLKSALMGHLHNKIVHFPLALGVAAAVMLLAAPRWPNLGGAARALLVAGALFGIAAYFSGEAQHDAFEDGMLEGIMRLHEKAGITTASLLVLGVVVTSLEATRRWRWLYALLLLAVAGFTGFLGGLLSHGPVG
jgi:uncharacterized membrane protein